MNKQQKFKNGQLVSRGIEWSTHTWNPVGGCRHACRWEMPDGTIAECYAKTVAERLAQASYPDGFEAHYWRPELLPDPLQVKEPARIFLDSMSDLMGLDVNNNEIKQVLDICRQGHWHTFLALTKNAPRLAWFDWPLNVHVGVSMPPDWWMGKRLDRNQQERMLRRALETLLKLRERQPGLVTWMSFEPISWHVAPIVAAYPGALRWAVIGAASNGPRYYQPDPAHVAGLLEVLDRQGVPVFMKGNLKWSPWREEYPDGQ